MWYLILIYYLGVFWYAFDGQWEKAFGYGFLLPGTFLMAVCFRIAWLLWRHPEKFR